MSVTEETSLIEGDAENKLSPEGFEEFASSDSFITDWDFGLVLFFLLLVLGLVGW